MLQSLLAVPLLFSAALALPVPGAWSKAERAACDAGVYIIVARGSTEAQGEGPIAPIAADVVAKIGSSVSVAVVYPATLWDYDSSVADGVTAMTALIQQYTDSCPTSKIVLMGYSQGAQVAGDTLIGKDSSTPGLAPEYLTNIAAVAIFGDPTHIAGQSYDVGTSTNDGIFARDNADLFISEGLAPNMHSWCDDNDLFCDSGDSISVHEGYWTKYTTAAASWVESKVV